MKRIILLSLLICLTLIALTMSGVPVSAAQNSQVSLQVDAGYGSYYRGQRWLPLRINVSNSGPDIRGELRVTRSANPGLTTGAYAAEIDLPNGSSKQVFLYATMYDGYAEVKVELAVPNGIVAEVVKPLRSLSSTDLLYVIVTDSPRSAIDLQDARPGIGLVQQVYWRIENLPENPLALDSINVLILSDVDTGKFTNNQQRAVADWVRSGGHLIVTGGPNWQKTQAGVTELLPLKPERSTTLTSLPSIANYAGFQNEDLDAPSNSPIIVAEGQVTDGAKVVIEQGGVPLLTRHHFGEGTVDYLAVDPSTEPLQSWSNRSNFWFTLLTSTGQQPSWTRGIIETSQAAVAANLIKGVRLPDVFQLCGFLLVYIILIGPLNYLLLKRIGRREWAWVTIPIIIVACSVVAYMTGFSLRGTQATINRLAMVQVWPGTTRAQVDGLIGVLAPRRSVYSIAMQDGMPMRFIGDSDTEFGPKIWEQNSYEARNVPVDAGITAVFATSGFIETTPLQGRAEIILPAIKTNFQSTSLSFGQSNPPRLVGELTNTTGLTLEDAVVIALGNRFELGILKPGDTEQFDLTLAPPNYLSPPLSLGNSQTWGFSGYYPGSGYYTPADMTAQDIMGQAYLQYYSGFGYDNNPTQQEYRRRQAFLSSIISDTDPSGGRGADAYVVGWTTSSPLNVGLQGAAHVTEDTTLYIYKLPVTFQHTTKEIEVPYPFMTWMSTPASNLPGTAPYNMNISQQDTIVYRYTPLPGLRLGEVTRLEVLLKAPYMGQADISLWDWQEQKWEAINAQRSVVIVDEPQRFVGPENTIEIQIETAAGSNGATFDRIDLALFGKLAESQSSS